jgi:hypothetical protein
VHVGHNGGSDQRYSVAYLYGAVGPRTDRAFAPTLPNANRHDMQNFIDSSIETVGAKEHEHTVDVD